MNFHKRIKYILSTEAECNQYKRKKKDFEQQKFLLFEFKTRYTHLVIFQRRIVLLITPPFNPLRLENWVLRTKAKSKRIKIHQNF